MAYGSRAHLAAAAAKAAGLKGEKLKIAIAIAMAESGGNPKAWGDRSLHKGSRGLWQIYVASWAKPGPPRFQNNPKALYNPLTNAKSMMAISSGGKHWGPWTTFRTGAYRRYLREAAAAVRWLDTSAGKKLLHDVKAKGGVGVPWRSGTPKKRKVPHGSGGLGHKTKLKITPAKLRADRDKLHGWVKHDVAGGRALVARTVTKHDSFVKANPKGADPTAPTADLVAHNTIHAALQTTHLVWDEAFRLVMQDFDLLAKILNQGADHADLTEAELTHEVNSYKDLA